MVIFLKKQSECQGSFGSSMPVVFVFPKSLKLSISGAGPQKLIRKCLPGCEALVLSCNNVCCVIRGWPAEQLTHFHWQENVTSIVSLLFSFLGEVPPFQPSKTRHSIVLYVLEKMSAITLFFRQSNSAYFGGSKLGTTKEALFKRQARRCESANVYRKRPASPVAHRNHQRKRTQTDPSYAQITEEEVAKSREMTGLKLNPERCWSCYMMMY